jgi:hypothetical protein
VGGARPTCPLSKSRMVYTDLRNGCPRGSTVL